MQETAKLTAIQTASNISEETAKNVLSMMESVVADGTGRNSRG